MAKFASEINFPETPVGKVLQDDGTFAAFADTVAGIKLARLAGDFADQETVAVSGNVTRFLTVMNASSVRTLTMVNPATPKSFIIKNAGSADCTIAAPAKIDGDNTYNLPPGDSVTLVWVVALSYWIVI